MHSSCGSFLQKHQVSGDQYSRETVKENFNVAQKKERKITKTINIEVVNEVFAKG